MSGIIDWLDNRAGVRALRRAALDEPIPGGARWSYVPGSALLFTFALQALTGIVMAAYYSPSTTAAWPSVWYLQHRVALGAVVRGIHHFGSSAMVVLCGLHIVQVFLYGAYRRPRELNWLFGVLLLFVVLGFALTGYLLPWDQKGYWATRVATGIAGSLPLVGQWAQRFLQGGAEYGHLTLTRFYALHILVLPATLVALVAVHVALFRRHGVTPPPHIDEKKPPRVDFFWPTQVLYDAVFAALVFAVLLVLAVAVRAPLEPPADPSSAYLARPEWYFLFLFQLLKYFEGPMIVVGTVLIPGLAAAFLLGLPWLDRAPNRSLRARWKVAIVFFGIFAGAGALTAKALVDDASDTQLQKALAAQEREAQLALDLTARGGVDPRGRPILYRGFKLFDAQQCSGCHALPGHPDQPKERKGPALAGLWSREWFVSFLKNPDSDRFYGGTKLEGEMPSYEDEKPDTLRAVAEWLASQTKLDYDPPIDPELARRGREIMENQLDCTDCHNLDRTPGDAPPLEGIGSRRWLQGFLRDPASPRYYGELNHMEVPENANSADIDDLIEYLRTLKDLPAPRP